MRCHRWQPTRLPCPWASPGKNTGVGCHFLLQCMKVKSESEAAQSCPTPSDPMDCSLPGSSIHGIFQARVLEWGAIVFSATEVISGFFLVEFCCGENGIIFAVKCQLWPHPRIGSVFFSPIHPCFSHLVVLATALLQCLDLN